MRLLNLIRWDIKFQFTYGFYFIYAVLTALYTALLFALPDSWKHPAAVLMIFSDPAAIGLFFMGAIVLLEKSQRVNSALCISPVRITEYIVSKVVSFALLSCLPAFFLALVSGLHPLPSLLPGTILTSIVFTLLGLCAAANITSLNRFILVTVPLEAICMVPAVLYLFDLGPGLLRFFPTSCSISLIAGQTEDIFLKTALIFILIAVLFYAAYHQVFKMWNTAGGVKL